MNKSLLMDSVVRAALIGMLALAAHISVLPLFGDDKTPEAASPSQLGKDLIGTWVLAAKPGEAAEVPGAGTRLKFFMGRHWCITQADPKTGATIFHHGGTYVLNGTEYSETIEYAIQGTGESDLIGKTLKFTLKIEGDTLTSVGIGNSWDETWKRAK